MWDQLISYHIDLNQKDHKSDSIISTRDLLESIQTYEV